ncbi:MAG: helix-turn-helix domain-containing protein, partial [Candidatus Acidiferrales bacterium]
MRKTGKHDWRRFDALTDAEVHAAAIKDPEAQPLTDEALARMKRVPRARTLRRALGLTQEEFAGRYHIPVGTLRDWEQGRSEPDQPARAYLTAIAHDPEGVCHALGDCSDIPTAFPSRKLSLQARLHSLIPHIIHT